MFTWSYKDITNFNVPDGVYTARITDITPCTSKLHGHSMWKFTLALKECNFSINHYQIIDGNLSPEATRTVIAKIAEIADCFQVPDGSRDPRDWIGRTGYISTKTTETENGRIFINVKKFFNPSKGKTEMFNQMQKKQADDFFAGALNLDTGFDK